MKIYIAFSIPLLFIAVTLKPISQFQRVVYQLEIHTLKVGDETRPLASSSLLLSYAPRPSIILSSQYIETALAVNMVANSSQLNPKNRTGHEYLYAEKTRVTKYLKLVMHSCFWKFGTQASGCVLGLLRNHRQRNSSASV